MTWLAYLLLGVAAGDLVRSLGGRWSGLSAPAGGVVSVVAALLGGLVAARGDDLVTGLVALVITTGLVVGWAVTVDQHLAGGSPKPPLAVLTASVVLGLALAPLAPDVAGPFADWLGQSGQFALPRDPTRAALVVALLGVQLSTGNLLVRLVLEVTGTQRPRPEGESAASQQLRGGRLLGPMERVFILGFGLAGHPTAAGLVIAAKGLLRFPELQSERRRGRAAGDDGLVSPGIHALTEYFLVGSFTSWAIALGSLALLSGG